MEIELFLEPIDFESLNIQGRPGQVRLADTLSIHTKEYGFPSLEGIKIAILGVAEERMAVNNKGCSLAPNHIREALYPLFHHWHQLQIADLGNIRTGHSIEDTYFALAQVAGNLLSLNIIPIVLGGSNDLTYALYQAYENNGQLVNILSIDPIFDIGQKEGEFNAQAFLSKLIMHQPNYLFNFTNIGYQSYFVDQQAVDLMKNLLFDVWRLGYIRAHMEEAEPALRNADLVTLDVGAIRASDAPANGNTSPNGFTGEEACRLARYAGMSDKLSCFGIFELNPSLDRHNITAQLAAQIIWYFFEGVANRNHDTPATNDTNFARYNVKIEGQEDELVFLRSKKTERWWIDLSFGRTDRKKYERHHFVPCSRKDYDLALTDEIPDRWWQFFQKLM